MWIPSDGRTTTRATGFDAATVTMDCDGCPVVGTGCGDCPVAFVLGREPDDAVVYDHATERALRLLREGGLIDEVVGRVQQGIEIAAM